MALNWFDCIMQSHGNRITLQTIGWHKILNEVNFQYISNQMHSKRNQHIYWFPDVGMRSMYGDRGSFNVSIDIYIQHTYISIWINVLWEWANIQLTAIFRYVLRQDDSEITELHHALIWFSNLALTFDSTCAYYFQICTFLSCLFLPTYCFTLKSGRKNTLFFLPR